RREVDAVDRRRAATHAAISRVVAQLELVDLIGSNGRLPGRDAVLRHISVSRARAGNVLWLLVVSLVAEETQIERGLVAYLGIKAKGAGVFVDRIAAHQLADVEIRASVRISHNPRRAGGQKPVCTKRLYGGDRRGAAGQFRHAFHDVDARTQAIAFIAAKEEELILHNRPAQARAELIEPQWRFEVTVEEVSRIQLFIA